ncbi:MAG TPA: hypothetical protein PKO06_03715, partial [Candidatus Ozemobacteraceae bacterium]|nr:hypothetical protein [Candidatus Ozemobacteraceae bacterium]
MNTLTVTLLSQETECGTECAVRFDVNGISLLDQLRSYEERFALREGHPSLAGSYSWLPATTHTRQSLQLAMSCHRAGAPTALLECACGVPGCWPMLATITYQDATVTW